MMKRVMCGVLLLCLVLSACGQKPPTWQEQYDLGVRYLSEGNYEEAVLAFTAAIEIDPKQVPAYIGRGDAYMGIARETEAPDSEELSEAGEEAYRKALEDYLSAIDLDGTLVEAYQKAAEIYIALGDMESAVALLERGVEVTDSAVLQGYLSEIEINKPLTVMTSKKIYGPDGTLLHEDQYSYDEEGYVLYSELTSYKRGEVIGTVRFEHEYSADKSTYFSYTITDGTRRVTEGFEEGEQPCPEGGAHMVVTPWYEPREDVGVCVWAQEMNAMGAIGISAEEIMANNGIYEIPESTFSVAAEAGIRYYVVYAFDENENPISISTYTTNDVLTGYCTLEWAVIDPISQ